MRCRGYSIVAASAVVVALLSDATGARGQGTGGPATEIQTIYQALTEHGVRPALIYDVEGFVGIAGGARRGATYLDNLNLQLTFDLEPLVGWRGATFFLYGLGIHGNQPSDFSGDAQGVSSIEAPRKWTLEEAWAQQSLFGNQFSAPGRALRREQRVLSTPCRGSLPQRLLRHRPRVLTER